MTTEEIVTGFPDEIYQEIITFLDLKTLCSSSLVSKKFYQFSNKQKIFQNLILKEYHINTDKNNPKHYYHELKQFSFPFKGIVSQCDSEYLYDLQLEFKKIETNKILGGIVWNIRGYPETTTKLSGTIKDKEYLEFSEYESTDPMIAMTDTNYYCTIIDNVFILGTWEVHTIYGDNGLYGSILVVLDEYRKQPIKNVDFEKILSEDSIWEGFGAIELLNNGGEYSEMNFTRTKLQIVKFTLEEFHCDLIYPEISQNEKTEQMEMTNTLNILKIVDNRIQFEDEMFLEIYDEYMTLGIMFETVMNLYCLKKVKIK